MMKNVIKVMLSLLLVCGSAFGGLVDDAQTTGLYTFDIDSSGANTTANTTANTGAGVLGDMTLSNGASVSGGELVLAGAAAAGAGDHGRIDWSAPNFEFEARFKLDAVGAAQYLADIGGCVRLIVRTDNKVQLTIWDDADTVAVNKVSSGLLSAGTWYNVVASYDSSGAYELIVKDDLGVVAVSKLGSGGTGVLNAGSSSFIAIGAYKNGVSDYFGGVFDEVKISSSVGGGGFEFDPTPADGDQAVDPLITEFSWPLPADPNVDTVVTVWFEAVEDLDTPIVDAEIGVTYVNLADAFVDLVEDTVYTWRIEMIDPDGDVVLSDETYTFKTLPPYDGCQAAKDADPPYSATDARERGDTNWDCKVNLVDLTTMALNWLANVSR
jgi:hypothetical protein